MKLILAGSTGFIGTEVLTQALSNVKIAFIVVLSRRPLPEPFCSNPKLKVVIAEDFTMYTEQMLAECENADACIWTLGEKSRATKEVTVNFPLVAAAAFFKLLRAPTISPFRFVYVSRHLAIQDQKAWFTIPIAGQAELNLLEITESSLDAFIARPGVVLPKDASIGSLVKRSLLPSVRVDELAAALLDVAVRKGSQQILENRDLVQKGREALSIPK
ncbi:hypothetical protein LZ554_008068 [Drepanopeziza brunnea f. sp. 'monogermtubi']|nr:hypothetical protein LZ554_008068 [Drepanopeziza brunnea f. sp. 'monogermtubi']